MTQSCYPKGVGNLFNSSTSQKQADKKRPDETFGITVSKDENFSQWYQEVVLKAEMVEYYQEISGFFILRPLSMFIWNQIKQWFQERLDEMDVEEASFRTFLSAKSIEKEKDHVEGFTPELAWTPIAVRPTSEAIMYPYYSKWLRSHRDLPLRLNQWNSVIRWEAKQTTPFLRTREFLWQEGHTAHLTEEDAGREILAVPVVRGRKTEHEKFAGAYYTMTVEGYIPANGRGIQGSASHCLRQNFRKMFDISVEDPTGNGHIHVWQNSWAFSSRVLGVMTVIVPVGVKKSTSSEEKQVFIDQIEGIAKKLKLAGVRVWVDDRDGYTPAWKFNDWELKGVPLRIEFGPRDAAGSVISYCRRDNSEKGTIPIDNISAEIPELLEAIQKSMYDRAEASYRQHRIQIWKWEDVLPALNEKNVLLIPFCLEKYCEERIKELTTRQDDTSHIPEERRPPTMGMKSLCIPFEQPGGLGHSTKCLNPKCGKMALKWTMFGRSY
ncbi:unnamed protein product [Clonostachys rhizophaga]|uniref:proline--tRNA ligase n=1 Tax=Clonostachys rhizophaga TaxID=160324 RepID=A0A9N9V4I7_9HYPO|nr:unnamed protein product [Clonostachys rhizophaga]